MWRRLLTIPAIAAVLAFSAAVQAAPITAPAPAPAGSDAPPGDGALSCAMLARTDFSKTPGAPAVVATAVVRKANADTPDLCVVDGNAAPTIGFRLWMPMKTWNGKFAQSGCGGRCADIVPAGCEIMSARGYACIAGDLGHKGTQFDVIWAVGNLQGQLDNGFRATHVATTIGKFIVTRFYGKAPRVSYFVGTSTGGRQGLIAAQRFPDDFDGVIAGDPAMGYIDKGNPMRRPAWPDSVVDAIEALYVGDQPGLTNEEIRSLHEAALRLCDMDDNLKDGIISDPLRCKFDPAVLQCKAGATDGCLSADKVTRARNVYAAGPLPGSEPAWIGAYMPKNGLPSRYGTTKSPKLNDPYAAWLFDATNPDLQPFKASGAKLIVYQGWADEATFPQNPVHYYETVEKLMGGRKATQDFFRLFMVPGQSHIPGNGGAENVDYLSYLEAWVERGVAPDALLAMKLSDQKRFTGAVSYPDEFGPGKVAFTRPVYPYPVQARYSGRGDPNDAASFVPGRPFR